MVKEFDESYPEHVKMMTVSEKSQVIGEFLDWIQHEREVVLCTLEDLSEAGDSWWPTSQYIPQHKSIEDMLAEYYGIDLKAIEQEKRQMIKELQEANDG